MITKAIKKVALNHDGYIQIEKKYVFLTKYRIFTLSLNINAIEYTCI